MGHSSILAAAGSRLQSLLRQDIHQSLLLRDQVFSPCSVRTLINPCCCGITSSVLALSGHSSILAAAGSRLQSLLCQDIHQSLLLRDHAFSPCFARTFIDPCCCGIQPPVLALSGHSSILAAAGSRLQSLLRQDIHRSLLLRDPVSSPCSVRTFIDPCCCGITSSVLALPGHSSVLAAAGSRLQSLLRQDIHRSLLLRDPASSPCSVRTLINPCCCGITSSVLALPGHSSVLAAAGSRLQSLLRQDIHQSLLMRDQVFSPCSARTFISPCCCGIKSSVLALSGHSSILAAAGSRLQSLLCQDTHQSLLLRDHVFSPCSARTFISPCCCGITPSVLASPGHSSILAAAGSSLQSLLCQDIHRSLLLRDHVFSPCFARTLIDPCCLGIQSPVLALSGHSSILAAAGSRLQSLLRQDIHRSLLLRDHVSSPCSVRTFIDPCCCGIQPPVLALSGRSSILAAAGSRLQSLLCQDIHQSLLLRDPASSPCSARTFIDPCCCGIQLSVLALAGSSTTLVDQGRPSGSCCRRICSVPGPRDERSRGSRGKRSLKDEQRRKNPS
ncbi:hypothetical protein ACLKA7_000885 [Drosophila subpalustris]